MTYKQKVAETVARLRARPLYEGHGEASDLPDDAADLLESLSARLAELEAERDDALAFLDNAISDAPEPLKTLGAWLANLLDEDLWPTAERHLNAAVKSLADTLRYCEVQWQDADRVAQEKMLQERARAEAAESALARLREEHDQAATVYIRRNTTGLADRLEIVPEGHGGEPYVPQEEALAMVGAVIRDAGLAMANVETGFHDGMSGDWHSYDPPTMISHACAAIRALRPDATAALERYRKAVLEEAATLVGNEAPSFPDEVAWAVEDLAKGIRALAPDSDGGDAG